MEGKILWDFFFIGFIWRREILVRDLRLEICNIDLCLGILCIIVKMGYLK